MTVLTSARLRLQRYPFLFTGRFLATALGHFTIDLFNSVRPLILAILSLRLGLSNTQVGIIAMSATFMASLSQPLFGWLADRYGGRWIATWAVVWMAGLYALVGLVDHPLIVWALVLGALGSAAFHPQGAMNAAQAGGDKRTLATSVFFTFGQAALGLGPAIGGVLFALFDLPALAFLALVSLPAAGLLWHHTPGEQTQVRGKSAETLRETAQDFGQGRSRWLIIGVFALLVLLRSWATHSNITFLPKFLQERGWPGELQGMALTTYMLSSAVAVIILGRLADEFGRRRVLRAGLFLAVLPLYLYPRVHGWPLLILVAMTGAFLGGVHSILVVMAQSLIPNRMALASGLILGFMFASGGIGQMLTGVLADAITLPNALSALALPTAAAACLSLLLPRPNSGRR